MLGHPRHAGYPLRFRIQSLLIAANRCVECTGFASNVKSWPWPMKPTSRFPSGMTGRKANAIASMRNGLGDGCVRLSPLRNGASSQQSHTQPLMRSAGITGGLVAAVICVRLPKDLASVFRGYLIAWGSPTRPLCTIRCSCCLFRRVRLGKREPPGC